MQLAAVRQKYTMYPRPQKEPFLQSSQYRDITGVFFVVGCFFAVCIGTLVAVPIYYLRLKSDPNRIIMNPTRVSRAAYGSQQADMSDIY